MTTALYRRYRPETFADVIGQEHVTDPLMAAISGQRASHAYLFSGPRGCGKTTSARILARCLNCENGPTPVPCGTCDSCAELARGGSGSLDVVEIDAASHNGVDDARELRERAAFAPARDRYKIFILDEAHMVTPQGFNALLKLVEEPPPHVKFIFATTEPEKVISTIRSRTHHYPFRLVPPDRLQAYLESICTAEGVTVGGGVLQLVVRAGGGSVRDSLSVLDQLIAGADGELDYAQAVALLGYTPETLLDDAVEALEAADGASVFRVVDRVIESGHDPRRFVEDLLQRLRDLIVIVAAGERAADVLRGVPEDQFNRMTSQAQRLGLAQLSRAGDLTMTALTEMTGATSPRLQLELLCARLLLPAADEPLRGHGARLERLERLLEAGAPAHGSGDAASTLAAPSPVAAAPVAAAPVAAAPVAEPPAVARVADVPAAKATPAAETSSIAGAAPPAPGSDEPVAARGGPAAGAGPTPPVAAKAPASRQPRPAGTQQEQAPPSSAEPAAGGLDTETVRRRWPEVLETLSRIRRVTWTLTSQNAQVVALTGTALRLRFDTAGIASAFRNGRHAEAVERALLETLGLSVQIEAVVDERGPGQGSGGRSAGGPRTRSQAPTESAGRPDHAARAAADWAADGDAERPAVRRDAGSASKGSAREREHADSDQEGSKQARPDPADAVTPNPEEAWSEPTAGRPTAPQSPEATRSGTGTGTGDRASSSGPAGVSRDWLAEAAAVAPPASSPPRLARTVPPVQEVPDPDEWSPFDSDEPDPEDSDLDLSPLVGAQLVQRVFGATVIDEIPVDPTGVAPRSGT